MIGMWLSARLLPRCRSIVEQTGAELAMRVGIDSGSAVCGVVGLKKWHYDVWSEAVENAYYLQSTATPESVALFHQLYERQQTSSLAKFTLAKRRSLPSKIKLTASQPITLTSLAGPPTTLSISRLLRQRLRP